MNHEVDPRDQSPSDDVPDPLPQDVVVRLSKKIQKK